MGFKMATQYQVSQDGGLVGIHWGIRGKKQGRWEELLRLGGKWGLQEGFGRIGDKSGPWGGGGGLPLPGPRAVFSPLAPTPKECPPKQTKQTSPSNPI